MDPFIGEIRPFAFGYNPVDWVVCNGQLLSIQQWTALYSILGTQFGGDGKTTFGVPDLRGLVALSTGVSAMGINYAFNTNGGSETITITSLQIPSHTHDFNGATSSLGVNGEATTPTVTSYLSNLVINSGSSGVAGRAYQHLSVTPPTHQVVPLNNNTIQPAYGNLPSNSNAISHENRAPFLAINYCICVNGVYPDFNN